MLRLTLWQEWRLSSLRWTLDDNCSPETNNYSWEEYGE